MDRIPGAVAKPTSEVVTFVVTCGLIAVAVMIVGPSILRTVDRVRRGSEVDPLRLAQQLKGKSVSLPTTDYFGRPIKLVQGIVLVVLPGCNRCAIDRNGATKFPRPAGEAVFLTQDDSELSRFKGKLGGRHDLLIVDRQRLIAPQLAYDLAPVILTLGQKGVIEQVVSPL